MKKTFSKKMIYAVIIILIIMPKVVSTQFPPCVPAEIALISTLTRQVCTYQRLTYLLTLSTYRCADLTITHC